MAAAGRSDQPVNRRTPRSVRRYRGMRIAPLFLWLGCELCTVTPGRHAPHSSEAVRRTIIRNNLHDQATAVPQLASPPRASTLWLPGGPHPFIRHAVFTPSTSLTFGRRCDRCPSVCALHLYGIGIAGHAVPLGRSGPYRRRRAMGHRGTLPQQRLTEYSHPRLPNTRRVGSGRAEHPTTPAVLQACDDFAGRKPAALSSSEDHP